MHWADYSREWAKRALRGKFAWTRAATGVLTLLAIPIAANWRPEDEWLRWLPLGIFFLLFLAAMAFGFLTAPWRFHNEIESERDALQLQLDNRARRQGAIDLLWDLRSDGISLRNRPITHITELEKWQAEQEDWRERVLAAAEVVSINLRHWLARLDQMQPPPANMTFFTDEHRRRANIMSEILIRLQRYLEKEFL